MCCHSKTKQGRGDLMRNLKISVIIPTYNRCKYLKIALNSLLNQSCVPDEIIVIDDGSIDGTKEYLKVISKNNDIIKVFSQKNGGPSKARNLGIKKAKGDIICFFDDDEIAHRDWIKTIVETFEKFPSIGGVGGQCIEKKGKSIYEKYLKSQFYITKRHKELPLLGGNIAFWKKILQEVEGFDEKLIRCEDVDLSFRVYLRGYKIIYNKNMIIYHLSDCENLLKFIKRGYNLGLSQIILNKKYPNYFRPSYRILINLIYIIIGFINLPKNIIKGLQKKNGFYILDPFINLIYRSSIIIGILIGFLTNRAQEVSTIYYDKIPPFKEEYIFQRLKEKLSQIFYKSFIKQDK